MPIINIYTLILNLGYILVIFYNITLFKCLELDGGDECLLYIVICY